MKINTVIKPSSLIVEAGKEKVASNQLTYTPGFWMNGKMRWLTSGAEKLFYEEKLSIKSKQEYMHSKIDFYSLYITNHSDIEVNVKAMAMLHCTQPGNDHVTFISPVENVILHLANQKVFLVNSTFSGTEQRKCTTSPLWNVYTDQFWNSIDKGSLKYQPMAKGAAASIMSLDVFIPAKTTMKVNTWIASGESKEEVVQLDRALLKNRLAFHLEK